MFNNPLNSFHDIVAEAKEERERLDRLLTISTPRERLLVIAIATVLCILLAWLFFGNVARSIVVEGVLIAQDEPVPENSRSLQALVWIASDIVPPVGAGMPLIIETDGSEGFTGALGGQISTVSTVPVTEELAALEANAPVSAYRVHIELEEDLDQDFLKHGKCRIVIELGRQSPISLFRMRRP